MHKIYMMGRADKLEGLMVNDFTIVQEDRLVEWTVTGFMMGRADKLEERMA